MAVLTEGGIRVPFLKGENASEPHEALYWRFWKQAAVRSGDWKLICLGDGAEFLFNLAEPEAKGRNLALQHPDKVRKLRAQLAEWARQLSPPGLPKNGIQRERQGYEFYLNHKSKDGSAR